MSLRTLIVEDEPLIALELQSICEENGHSVIGIAGDMETALRIAEAHPELDLAIMDVGLAPGSNGIETARRLRKDHDLGSLFVTGKLDDAVRARAAVAGPVGFIGKPFSECEILVALRAMDSQAGH